MPDILRFPKAPIIEAVIDIDCDFPPKFALGTVEEASKEAFVATYPKFRQHQFREFTFTRSPGTPVSSGGVTDGVEAFRFSQIDGRQLVQVRAAGYSFNRLAPYAGLDDYLPEIERSWNLFASLTAPVQIKCIRLRYINRIMLPGNGKGSVDLDHYFKLGPRLPNPDRLTFVGFLEHHQFLDRKTGHFGSIVLTPQPAERNAFPFIFDITAEARKALAPDWVQIKEQINSLRELKNFIFTESLTNECLSLFQ